VGIKEATHRGKHAIELAGQHPLAAADVLKLTQQRPKACNVYRCTVPSATVSCCWLNHVAGWQQQCSTAVCASWLYPIKDVCLWATLSKNPSTAAVCAHLTAHAFLASNFQASSSRSSTGATVLHLIGSDCVQGDSALC
jgi:hypothetical protein